MSVQVTLTGLSFLVTPPSREEALYFKEYFYGSQYSHQDMLAALQKEIWETEIMHQCENVSLLYANTDYTLVPEMFFDESKLSEYLKFNSKILAGDYLSYDAVAEQSLNVVYVPIMSINNYLFEKFGTFNYYHSATMLLRYISEKLQTQEENQVFINCYQDHFDLVLLKSKRLQLCNSYKYKTPEDLIYYILFAFEQHEINPNSICTKVFGNITETDENFGALYRYIRNVELTALEKEQFRIDGYAGHQNLLLKTLA